MNRRRGPAPSWGCLPALWWPDCAAKLTMWKTEHFMKFIHFQNCSHNDVSFCVRTGMMASIYSRKLQRRLRWEGKARILRPLTAAHSDLTRERTPAPFTVKKTVMYENVFIHIPPSVFGRGGPPAWLLQQIKCSVSQRGRESNILPPSVCKRPF